MPTSKELYGVCPYFTSQKVLSGKWSLYILYLLTENKTLRFNELQRMMPDDMTHTTLSRQLKLLEDGGLINREEYRQIPPKVEYSLSEIGKEFREVINTFGSWGDKYIQYLKTEGKI